MGLEPEMLEDLPAEKVDLRELAAAIAVSR
jgi:hypothetical protein